MDDRRQSKPTDEHREEARKLRAIWERERDRLKLAGHGSQEAFGAEFNIGNQAAVGFFLNGKTPLSVKAAVNFARGLRCQVSDFSPRLAALLEAAPRADQPLHLSPEEQQLIATLRALPTEELKAKVSGFVAGLALASQPGVVAAQPAVDSGKQTGTHG